MDNRLHGVRSWRMTAAIELHLRRFFREHDGIHFQTWPGPIGTRLPGFRVMVIPPGPRIGLWTYASIGCHAVRDGDHANEFVLLAPDASDAHVELMTMVGHYHASPKAGDRLGVGHTVPIGRAWLPGSSCKTLLVSTPYPFGPELENCVDPDGHVQVVWLLPITEQEHAYAKSNGLEALEQKFDDAALEYWAPNRPSVV